MQRLREGQFVTLTPPDHIWLGEFHCVVAAVEGNQAVLLARSRVDRAPSADCMLGFEHVSHPVALKGLVAMGELPDELRFKVSDGVQLPPRRAASRLVTELPMRYTVGGQAEEETRLRDISSGGVRFEPTFDLGPGDLVTVTIGLPDGRPAIEAGAAFVRAAGDDVAAQFVSITHSDRTRIVQFVRERKLAVARELALAARVPMADGDVMRTGRVARAFARVALGTRLGRGAR